MSKVNPTLDSKVKRQEMYKAGTPPWKETYRLRCLERLRENRAKHHEARRQLHDFNDCDTNIGTAREGSLDAAMALSSSNKILSFDDIMKEEWERMTSLDGQLHETYENLNSDAVLGVYEGIFEEIKKEIQADLRKEELRLLSFQALCDERIEEEEVLCSALEALMTDEVICPLCEKSSLIENKGVIVCKCGLRIDTEQDCISLKNVRDNLQAGTEEHSRSCGTKPSFSFAQKFGISNLLMFCKDCDFLYVIM